MPEAVKFTLSKSERLCSDSRIDALFVQGHRGSAGPLRFRWLASPRNGTETKDDAPVSILFSVPKKMFKRAWKRNLIKRRMRESYRQRKHKIAAVAAATGQHIDIAFVCAGGAGGTKGAKGTKGTKKAIVAHEIPDFKTIDNAIAKILEKILARNQVVGG